MKTNWKIIIGATIFVIAFVACSEFGGRRIVIKEVGVPQHFVLTTSQENPATIRIALSGNLNGRASFGIIEIGPGKISRNLWLDCYVDTFLIKYAPIDATEGEIVLRYWY